MADDQSDENTADSDGFEHPDEDDIDVVDMDEDFDLDEVDEGDAADLVDDEERIERLRNKADELAAQSDDTDRDADSDDPADGGTRVRTRTETSVEADGGAAAAGSMFSDEEADQIEGQFGDALELDPVDDIPDDFSYEAQDTSHFGVDDEPVNIEHNDTIFRLEHPTGAKEDKFWGEMQQATSQVDLFDTLLRYVVTRPRDLDERMAEENWSSFAKVGLAAKCSKYIGLDQLQDF